MGVFESLLYYVNAQKSYWRNLQPVGLHWHWQLESKHLDANQLSAASSTSTATSCGANVSKTS